LTGAVGAAVVVTRGLVVACRRAGRRGAGHRREDHEEQGTKPAPEHQLTSTGRAKPDAPGITPPASVPNHCSSREQ